MIALMNILPRFCPQCGEPIRFRDNLSRQDWYAKASHSCKCGLSYQYAESADLVEAAAKTGGDLARYVQE